MKNIIIFSLLIFLIFPAAAQTGDYEILAAKNAFNRSSKNLKPGQFLKKKDCFVLDSGACLILSGPAGNLLELNKKGEWKLGTFSPKFLPESSYLSFVAGQLRGTNNQSRQLRKKGWVSSPPQVIILQPKVSYFLGNQIQLNWCLYDNKMKIKGFQIIVMDMSDEIVKKYPPIKDPTVREFLCDLNDLGIDYKDIGPLIFKIVGIKNDGKYTAPIDYELRGVAFMFMEDEESGPIREELNAIAPAGPKPSVLQKLVAARFFETKNLFSDAAAAYRDALELSQNLPTIRRLYDDFLYRNILTKEAYLKIQNPGR